jgi:cold shock CspA family protein
MADHAGVTRYLGTVSAKRKAFGFIRSKDSPVDVFFHSSSCTQYEHIAVGEAVEFTVEQQPGGKKAAIAVCRARQAVPDLQVVESATHVGLVATDTAVGKQSSGFLRYMDQQNTVQHLTFSRGDLASGITSVARGQLVQFHIIIDRRQQLQQSKHAAAHGTAGTSSKHAFMRATQLRPLSNEEQVRPEDPCMLSNLDSGHQVACMSSNLKYGVAGL